MCEIFLYIISYRKSDADMEQYKSALIKIYVDYYDL